MQAIGRLGKGSEMPEHLLAVARISGKRIVTWFRVYICIAISMVHGNAGLRIAYPTVFSALWPGSS